MKLFFAILLCLVPTGGEITIDYLLYYKKGKVDKHTLTMIIRLAVMAGLCYLNTSVAFWQSALLTFSFHLVVFPIVYNTVVLKEHWAYLGTTSKMDVLEQKLRNKITTPGVLFLKLALLMSGIAFYINPSIR